MSTIELRQANDDDDNVVEMARKVSKYLKSADKVYSKGLLC